MAVWTIFHMLQKLVLESNLPVRVSIRCFRRKLGPSGFFALQSAIFFIAVLFLMASINICRVISTFITQGAFLYDVACYAWWLFLNWKLPLCGHIDLKSHNKCLWLCWWTAVRWCDNFLVRFDWQKFALIERQTSFVHIISVLKTLDSPKHIK